MNVIISLEITMNCWTWHLIKLNPIEGTVTTLKTGSISNKNQINELRSFIENKDYKGHIEWWTKKFNLIHKTITISYGPILRDWIKRYNNSIKEEN